MENKVLEWQETTWVEYCQEKDLHLECNLCGHWRVRQGDKTIITYVSFDSSAFTHACNRYVELLKSIKNSQNKT